MHDIWNPWHGCRKASEGCANCYMFTMDRWRGLDGSVVRRNKAGFRYPLSRSRDGSLKVLPGELIRVCMTSDFFVEEADPWREEAWDVIRQRPDVKFWLLTKRPERLATCLPDDWGAGWANVMLNVTCENQRRADERIPVLLATPARHKGIMCAPLIGRVSIERYLAAGDAGGPDVRGCGIEQVVCGGENYDGARPCDFDWVRLLAEQCRAHDVTFAFTETGTVFVKDGRTYRLRDHRLQSEQAFKSGVSFRGRPIEWRLTDALGLSIPDEGLYQPHFCGRCATCGQRLICNGCSDCGRCG